mmetsp:Transcript_40788/g.95684  ORF Transcript_40788/g.95684 Transcript_40788/m.95684 type:complete len:173 (+) Transcript_40788:2049-2567(+)
MVIQLGYVCLFASAYPLAATIAFISNVIEVRTDATKIAFVHRKCHPERISNIGIWNTLISIIIWSSALTNCLIFCFTSHQMAQWLPEMQPPEGDNENWDAMVNSARGMHTVLLMFVLEHCILLFGVLLYSMIPSVPMNVVEQVEHRTFVRKMLARLQRRRNSKASSLQKVTG